MDAPYKQWQDLGSVSAGRDKREAGSALSPRPWMSQAETASGSRLGRDGRLRAAGRPQKMSLGNASFPDWRERQQQRPWLAPS